MTPVAAKAAEITQGLVTEREKVTALFHWVTGNISYKVASRISVTPAWRVRSLAEEDTSSVLKPLDERVAENVLAKREAVCDGYARLFKTLCQYAGIKAEVVTGYARGSSNRGFRSNHSWNAVMIENNWYLVDATWAAGYVGYFGDTFIRSYDNRYFLAAPQQFIEDHYPEDPFWTLLPQLQQLPEFNRSPFRHSGYVRQHIIGYAPYEGILEAEVGDTLHFELESNMPGYPIEIWDRPFGDPRLHTGPVWRNYPEQPFQASGRKVKLSYVVQTPEIRWLYVVYGGESILQYRLQVKPSPVAGTAK
ncbi:transglutaminase domain-containing protein [Cnuella takakiae]|nr:transglutaminase domain-containing protein [Cnuella takakiae]